MNVYLDIELWEEFRADSARGDLSPSRRLERLMRTVLDNR